MDYLYTSLLIFLILSSLGFIVTSSNMKVWKKIFIIVALSISGVLSYRSSNTMAGYPKMLQTPSKDALVVGFHIDKKNSRNPKNWVIYLFLVDFDDEGNQLEPISYKMPFEYKVAQQLEIKRMQKRGKPFYMNIKSKVKVMDRYGNTVEDVEIKEKPLPILPPKSPR